MKFVKWPLKMHILPLKYLEIILNSSILKGAWKKTWMEQVLIWLMTNWMLGPAKTKWHIFYEPVLRLHYHFQVTELEPWKLKQMSSTQSVLNSCFVLSTHILESKKRLYFRIDAVVSPCVIVWGGLPQCLIIGRHSSPLH